MDISEWLFGSIFLLAIFMVSCMLSYLLIAYALKMKKMLTRFFVRFTVGLCLSSLMCAAVSADILDRLMWGAVGAAAVGVIHAGIKNGCHPVKDIDTGQTHIVCKKVTDSSLLTQSSTKEPPVDDAMPGRETKGSTTQWEKKGGMDEANNDFDKMNPTDINPIPDGGRVGNLPDGRKIIVRPNSKDGRPTLEIQNGKKKDKVRYGT